MHAGTVWCVTMFTRQGVLFSRSFGGVAEQFDAIVPPLRPKPNQVTLSCEMLLNHSAPPNQDRQVCETGPSESVSHPLDRPAGFHDSCRLCNARRARCAT